MCYAHGLHLAVCDVLYSSDGVVHIAVEDYNHHEEDDEDKEIFREGPATSVFELNDALVFNLDIENVLKKVRKAIITY